MASRSANSDQSRLDRLEALVTNLVHSNQVLSASIANKKRPLTSDEPELVVSRKQPRLASNCPSPSDTTEILTNGSLSKKGTDKVPITLKVVSADEVADSASAVERCSLPEEEDLVPTDLFEDESGPSLSDLGALEEELQLSFADDDVSPNSHSSPNSPTSPDFPIIGDAIDGSWLPSSKALSWFQRVANIGLSDEQIKSIEEDFRPDSAIVRHFEPPLLPSALWDSVKASKPVALNVRACHKGQSYISTVLKPLLSVLDSLGPEDDLNRAHLASAIQLLTTANLHFNRFRRTLAAPGIRKEFRRPLLANPVSHDSLFGEDFAKTTETVLKDCGSAAKVVCAPSSFRRSYASSRPQPGPSSAFPGPSSSFPGSRGKGFRTSGSGFRASGSGSFRSRGRARGRGSSRGRSASSRGRH